MTKKVRQTLGAIIAAAIATVAMISGAGAAGPESIIFGDVNCDLRVNSIDSALVLQLEAGIIGEVPCPNNADANLDGSISSIDAALILQFDAGLTNKLGNTVLVSLVEFDVLLDRASAASGQIQFDIANDGAIPHDFWLIDTDLAPDALPLTPDELSVDTSALTVLEAIPVLDPGESLQAFTILPGPATYVLICNLAGHYDAGMFTTLTLN